MELDTDKCHLIVSSIEIRNTRFKHSSAKIGDDMIWESDKIIDNKLKFDGHIPNICLKANQKLSAEGFGEVVSF